MAYDDLNDLQLAAEALDHIDRAQKKATNGLAALDRGDTAAARYNVNTCENLMLTAEARQRELVRRMTPVEPEPEQPPPPEPVPTEPQPAPGEPITGWVRADSVKAIPRFTTEELRAMLRTVGPSVDNGADLNGAYRVNDYAVKGGLIDPFFRYGQERAGHHHTIFGNPLVNAWSMFDDLRREGVGSSHAGAMDGGAQWVPTIFAWNPTTRQWVAVTDVRLIRYYKGPPDVQFWPEIAARSPKFAAAIAAMHPQNREWYEFHRLVELPHGMRFIAGVTNGTARFGSGGDQGLLTVEVKSNPLWDGVHIDAPDHISHTAPAKRDRNYRLVVNPDYPLRTVVITMKFGVMSWPEGVDPTTACVSSDLQHNAKPFDTLHAEYVEGQEPAVKTMWHDNAINRHLNCSSANLGNGLACREGPDPDPATFHERFTDLTVPFV